MIHDHDKWHREASARMQKDMDGFFSKNIKRYWWVIPVNIAIFVGVIWLVAWGLKEIFTS